MRGVHASHMHPCGASSHNRPHLVELEAVAVEHGAYVAGVDKRRVGGKCAALLPQLGLRRGGRGWGWHDSGGSGGSDGSGGSGAQGDSGS